MHIWLLSECTEAPWVVGQLQGGFVGPRTKGRADATVTSGSLCDSWPHVLPNVAMLGVEFWGLKDALMWQELGAEGLWMSPWDHFSCQRDRLPPGQGACPPAPLLFSVLQPPPHPPVWGPCATRCQQQYFQRVRGLSLPSATNLAPCKWCSPPCLTGAEEGRSIQMSCRREREVLVNEFEKTIPFPETMFRAQQIKNFSSYQIFWGNLPKLHLESTLWYFAVISCIWSSHNDVAWWV